MSMRSSPGATVDGAADATAESRSPQAPADLVVVSAARAAIRGATPIALAGFIANVANIGVTLLVARILSTRGYGALNQLIAVFFVLSITGSALLVGVVRRVTLWERTGHAARVDGWAAHTRRRALIIVAVWSVVAIAVRTPLADQLSLPGPGGLSETLIAGAVWGVLCLERGLLQARHAYRQLGANLLVEGLSRCVLTLVLVGAGFGVTGAAVAILASVVLGELHALVAERAVLHRRLRAPVATLTTPDAGDALPTVEMTTVEHRHERRRLGTDLISALIALALLAVLQNFDVVLLGREQPSNAGSYAPISVASKPLVLAAFVLAGFLLPEAASRRHAGQHALHQLGVVLAVIAAPASLLIVLALSAPTQLLRAAFGARLTEASPAFAYLAGAMTLLAATVLFTHYLLAAGRHVVLPVLAAGASLMVVLLLTAHGALVDTARADLLAQVVVALVTGGLVLHTALHRAFRQPVS
jgi:O-antigen/teichoic acid export membrane protein